MPWLFESWHINPGVPSPGEPWIAWKSTQTEGRHLGKKLCLIAGGRSGSCLCSIWRISPAGNFPAPPLMSTGKIPLGFSDNICSQWVDGTPVRFRLIFWVRKLSETSPCCTCRRCGKGKTPQKHSTRRSLVLAGRLCDLVTSPCPGECHWHHKMGFIVGRYVNQTTNSRLFGCP